MSATKHKLLATIPCGDPDLGAEMEAMITFNFTKGSADYWNRHGGHWEQGWGAEIEFVSAEHYCNGKPSPFYGAFSDMEQSSLNDLAENWLESDDGQAAALAIAAEDSEPAPDAARDAEIDDAITDSHLGERWA